MHHRMLTRTRTHTHTRTNTHCIHRGKARESARECIHTHTHTHTHLKDAKPARKPWNRLSTGIVTIPSPTTHVSSSSHEHMYPPPHHSVSNNHTYTQTQNLLGNHRVRLKGNRHHAVANNLEFAVDTKSRLCERGEWGGEREGEVLRGKEWGWREYERESEREFVCMRWSAHVCVCVCLHVCVCKHTHAHTLHTHTHTHTHMLAMEAHGTASCDDDVSKHVSKQECATSAPRQRQCRALCDRYTHTHTHTHMHIYMYMHMHI